MKSIRDGNDKSWDIKKAYHGKKYIVAFKSVYQPHFSASQGQYYAREVYHSSQPLTRPGRFYHMDAAAVNHLIGHELLAAV
jgi:hypothetical protein